MRPLPGVLLLVLMAGCATTSRRAPSARHFETLPSGMRLVVYERPEAPGATLYLSYRVGAADEPEGQEGIGHLTHLLTFLARPEGPESPKLVERLGTVGARFVSVMDHDETAFVAEARPLQLARLFELEAQRMRAPLAELTEAEFLAARERYLETLRSKSRVVAAADMLRRELLPAHPYGRPHMGTVASVQGLTLETVRAFARRHYTPERAVLVVMGPMPPRDVARAARASFGALGSRTTAAPVERKPPPLPEPNLPGRLVLRTADVDGPQLWLAWRAPGRSSGKFVETKALAENLRTFIFPALVRAAPQPLLRRSSVGAWDMDGVSILYVVVELERSEDAESVLAALNAQMARSWGTVVSNITAEALRDRVAAQAARDAEQLPPSAVSKYLRATGRADFPEAWPQQARDTLLWDIVQAVKAHALPAQAYGLLLTPRAPAARPAP